MREFVSGLILIALMSFVGGWASGCTEMKISREFSYTMEDGSRVTISMEYKPRSKIRESEKFGSYYYIVQHFPHQSKDDVEWYAPHVRITFYDSKGYFLYRFAPGWSVNEDEEHRIDGGWEWKGRLSEEHITVENFRDIHSLTVKHVEH